MATGVTVVTAGVQGPAGPASVAVGSVITARGRLAVGNSVGTPIALAPGASGTYLRSNGTDPLYSALLAADLPTGIDAAKLADGTVTSAELQFINTLTSNAQTQINGKAATAHNHLSEAERGFSVLIDAQTSATPASSTTSTVTYSDALQETFSVPAAGTWAILAFGLLNLLHSASGQATMRVIVGANDTTPRTAALDASKYIGMWDTDSLSIVFTSPLTFSVKVQFRSSDAGTTTVRNPGLLCFAYRTA